MRLKCSIEVAKILSGFSKKDYRIDFFRSSGDGGAAS